MPTEIAVALIGLVGVLAGGLIKTYSEELKELARLSRNKDLLGDWECVWTIEKPQKERDISDTVTIEKIAGEKLAASAHTPRIGRYRLTGRLSPSYLITFTYTGLAQRSPLGGVVILKLNEGRDAMRGYWHELDKDGVFWSGSTAWRKKADASAAA